MSPLARVGLMNVAMISARAVTNQNGTAMSEKEVTMSLGGSVPEPAGSEPADDTAAPQPAGDGVSRGIDLWPTVHPLLAANSYLVLATADAEGRPWVTPLFFALLDEEHLVWVSSPDSRHSQNLGVRARAAATVFDSHAAIGRAEAVYLEVTASMLKDNRLAVACERLNARLPPAQQLGPDDIGPGAELRVYQARVTEFSVLVRGGDTRFTNGIDTRLVVTSPR